MPDKSQEPFPANHRRDVNAGPDDAFALFRKRELYDNGKALRYMYNPALDGQAAADLYGKCGTEYRAVQRAWSAVDVAGKDAPCN